MTHVTCRLTAKNRDRHTLGNRVWDTFTFFLLLNHVSTEKIRSIIYKIQCVKQQLTEHYLIFRQFKGKVLR